MCSLQTIRAMRIVTVLATICLLIPTCLTMFSDRQIEENYFPNEVDDANGLMIDVDTPELVNEGFPPKKVRRRRAVNEKCDAFLSDKRPYEESMILDLPTIGKTREARHKTLAEIHIRHNLKGNVEIRDSSDDILRIQIVKSSGKEEELSLITQQHRLQETPAGPVLFVQVDYKKTTTSLLTIIGGVAAVLILFSLIILVIWIYHKRHMEESPPTATGRARQWSASQGGASSPSRRAHTRAGGSTQSSPTVRRPGTEHPPPHRNRGSSENVQPLPLPPPPRTSVTGRTSDQKRDSGSRGAGSSPRSAYRGTMVTFTVLSLVSLAYGALCPRQPTANIVITIPRGFPFGSVNVYFAKENKGHLIMDQWSLNNDTYKHVHTFDLKDASPSTNSICATQPLCAGAHHQGLAGCDIARQQCVCSRGYQLIDKVCQDVNECEEDPAACPNGVTCTNKAGYHLCNCPLGFFYRLGKCQRCSAACPDGQFEVKQCSARHDRICQECSQCPKAEYSIRPCGGIWDNECIHAAHPALMARDETLPFFIQDLRRTLYIDKRRKRRLHSNWSDNVFVEDLHNTRDLETTFYATAANEQQYGFWWVRESKVKVNIGLEEVNIFPKFTDVDHVTSDNSFMEMPSNGALHMDSKWFNKMKRTVCRYPVPDFYKIILEIGRDRMTNATERRCHLNDQTCLEKVTDFKRNSYVDRKLNDGCTRRYYRKEDTYPEELMEMDNSVVCVNGATAMIEDIFGLTENHVTPLHRTSDECGNADSKCEKCMKANCREEADPFTNSCCKQNCYDHKPCKDRYSSKCQRRNIECAQGDAYSFTLEPRFRTTDHKRNASVQCHIRHQKPDLLYRLWFYVSIEEIKLDLPKISHEVYSSDVQGASWGTYKVEFIDLEHNAIINLEDELMLVGELDENDAASKFTVYPLKKPDEYVRTPFDVEPITEKKSYETAVQFNEIFGYSTSSWSKNHCQKDISKFYPVQPHYKDEPQKVNIIMETVKSPYKYYMKHDSGMDPYLKFSTPANTSVLKWWFKDQSPALVIDDSLQLHLQLLKDDRLWNISLQGTLTECDGYLAITINDRIESAELFKYDTIIKCNSKGVAAFNASFKIPHFGSGIDKTFDIILDDAKTEYRVFLTHLNLEADPTTKVEEVTVQTADNPTTVPVLLICIINVAIVLMVCVSLCLYLATHQKKDCVPLHDDQHYYDTLIDPSQSRPKACVKHNTYPQSNCCTALRHMTTSRMMVVILYITFKVIYSFAFTFSVFFTVLVLLIQGHLETVAQVGLVQLRHHNESIIIQKQVERHVQREVQRQVEQVRSTQNACYGYLDEVALTFATDVDNITEAEQMRDFFLSGPSITNIVRDKYNEFVESYGERLDQHERDHMALFNRSLNYHFKRYMAFLDSAMYQNPWLAPWANYFNLTTKDPNYFQYDDPEFVAGPIQGKAVDFAEFAHVNEVIDVELWPIQFWERYHSMPEIPTLDMETFANGQCEPTSIRRVLSETNSHTDSVFFVYPQTSEPEQFIESKIESVFSVQEFLEELNLGILRLVFFSMDILLIFYRFTHLYLAVRSLCLGFIERIHLNAEDIKESGGGIIHRRLDYTGKHYTEQYIPLRPTYELRRDVDDTTQISDQDTLSSIIPPTNNHQPQQQTSHAKHKSNGEVVHGTPTNGGTTSSLAKSANAQSKIYHRRVAFSNGIHRLKTSLKLLLEGTLLPKFVFGTGLLLILSVTINFAQNFMTVENLVMLTCFVPDLPGLRWHIDSANNYLGIMAEQLYSTSYNWFNDHVTSELKYMQSFQEYFNQDQERRTRAYITEGCTVQGVFYSNGSCHIHREPPKLDIPMMPCNFVPIQPFLYTDHNLTILEDSIEEHYSPIIQSSQSIILYTIHGALIAASIMLILHAVGVLFLYYFKIKNVFPTREIFVVPTSVNLRSLLCSPRAGTIVLSQYGTDTTIGQYDTSFETEELEIDDSLLTTSEIPSTPQYSISRFDPAQHARTVQFKDVPSFDDPDSGSRTLPLQTSSPRIVPKTVSQTIKPMKLAKRSNPQALTDMGYSETKV